MVYKVIYLLSEVFFRLDAEKKEMSVSAQIFPVGLIPLSDTP